MPVLALGFDDVQKRVEAQKMQSVRHLENIKVRPRRSYCYGCVVYLFVHFLFSNLASVDLVLCRLGPGSKPGDQAGLDRAWA